MNGFNERNRLAESAPLSDRSLGKFASDVSRFILKCTLTKENIGRRKKIPHFLLRPEPSIDAQVPGCRPCHAIPVLRDVDYAAAIGGHCYGVPGAAGRAAGLEMPIRRRID